MKCSFTDFFSMCLLKFPPLWDRILEGLAPLLSSLWAPLRLVHRQRALDGQTGSPKGYFLHLCHCRGLYFDSSVSKEYHVALRDLWRIIPFIFIVIMASVLTCSWVKSAIRPNSIPNGLVSSTLSSWPLLQLVREQKAPGGLARSSESYPLHLCRHGLCFDSSMGKECYMA